MVADRATYDDLVRDLAAVQDLAKSIGVMAARSDKRTLSLQRLAFRGAITSSFSLLEAYVRTSFISAGERIEDDQLKPSDLPAFLLNAIRGGALKGLSHQVKIAPATSKLQVLLAEAARLNTLDAGPVVLPRYFGGQDTSNLSVAGISTMLKAFGVRDPWKCLQKVCSGSGLSTVEIQTDFEDSVRLRNLAAHDPTWAADIRHLQQVTRTMSQIALSFEVVLGLGLERFRTASDLEELQAEKLSNPHPCGIRKVRDEWRLLEEGGAPGRQLGKLKRPAISAARREQGFLGVVVVDTTWGPVSWR